MKTYPDYLASVMEHYATIKNSNLKGRYITYSHISPELKKLSSAFKIRETGKSTLQESIPVVEIGKGSIKILAWSQMHGNESTTTKAVFDLLNAFAELKDENKVVGSILRNCTIRIIPMLNPDGAKAYTRANANKVDLNRDAQNLNEVESRLLREEFNVFQPNYCLNLHDQRSIFSIGSDPKPATLSFLAPSMDNRSSVNHTRIKAMQGIVAIFKALEGVLSAQIGRYDDAFNIHCTGDTYQSLNVPTILFEAGHFNGDYEREKTREYVFASVLTLLWVIATEKLEVQDYREYDNIPQNEKRYNDIILRNARIGGAVRDVSLQFNEQLEGGKVNFIPVIAKIAAKIKNYGHREIDCKGEEIEIIAEAEPAENVIVNKILLKGKELELKSK